MTAVIRAHGLGKTYGRRAALSDCTLDTWSPTSNASATT